MSSISAGSLLLASPYFATQSLQNEKEVGIPDTAVSGHGIYIPILFKMEFFLFLRISQRDASLATFDGPTKKNGFRPTDPTTTPHTRPSCVCIASVHHTTYDSSEFLIANPSHDSVTSTMSLCQSNLAFTGHHRTSSSSSNSFTNYMTSMSSNQHPKPSIYSNTCMIHICTGSPSFACLFFVHESEKSKEAGTPGAILPPGHILLKRIFLFDECHQYDVPHAVLSAVLDTFSTTFAIPTTTTLAIPTISQGLYYHLPWTAVSPSAEFPLPASAYPVYYSTSYYVFNTPVLRFDNVYANLHDRSPIAVDDAPQNTRTLTSCSLDFTYYYYEDDPSISKYANGFVCLALEILSSMVPRTVCSSMFLCNDMKVAGFCYQTEIINLPAAPTKHQTSVPVYFNGFFGRMNDLAHSTFQLSWTTAIFVATMHVINVAANVQFLQATIDYFKKSSQWPMEATVLKRFV